MNQYLASMQTLINEYGPGGSAGRATPVTFTFMTGHANRGNSAGAGNPRDQAAPITAYCTAHGYYCIDYYSIDTHALGGRNFEDAGDNCDSTDYGGNFCGDWQRTHARESSWYYNRQAPGGRVSTGVHNNRHITANRKAFTFWWVMARLAGHNGREVDEWITKRARGSGPSALFALHGVETRILFTESAPLAIGRTISGLGASVHV